MTHHLEQGFNIEETARALKISRTALFHAVNKHFGISPIELLKRRRIERAEELLRCSTLNLRSIALNCGYRSVEHFCRQFKAQQGMTPGQYRKRYHEKK